MRGVRAAPGPVRGPYGAAPGTGTRTRPPPGHGKGPRPASRPGRGPGVPSGRRAPGFLEPAVTPGWRGRSGCTGRSPCGCWHPGSRAGLRAGPREPVPPVAAHRLPVVCGACTGPGGVDGGGHVRRPPRDPPKPGTTHPDMTKSRVTGPSVTRLSGLLPPDGTRLARQDVRTAGRRGWGRWFLVYRGRCAWPLYIRSSWLGPWRTATRTPASSPSGQETGLGTHYHRTGSRARHGPRPALTAHHPSSGFAVWAQHPDPDLPSESR